MNKIYKVIWSMALNTWVVVSEISSFIKKKSCCLCSGLILVSPFSLGADIECLYSSCYADDNIIITTERNLIDEAKQQYPSSRYAALFVGQKSETNLRVISGGKVTASTLQVGVNNNSVVDIRDGGEIIIDDYGQNITSLFNIGQGGEGVVNIDGAGSVLNFIPGDEEINVGYSSTGYLNITNGGKFISTPSDSSWGSIYAGGRGGASGVIKVSGKGSLLEPAYRLYVGVWGDGKLEVTSGGIVNTQNFQMGYIASGEAIVSGTGSQLNIDNTAAIVSTTNINARGTLIINNGGKVTADAIALGNTDNYDKPSTGVAEV
ncbi:TPA: ESPR-type extended signal peptide-containing protein, partial [Escherichia coli]